MEVLDILQFTCDKCIRNKINCSLRNFVAVPKKIMFLDKFINHFSPAEPEWKMNHVFVSICVGYMSLLIITAAILWYIMYACKQAYPMAKNTQDRVVVAKNPTKAKSDIFKPVAAGDFIENFHETPKEKNPKKSHQKRQSKTHNCRAQTEGNVYVDTLYRRMIQYRISDKNIDRFLAMPHNRSIICANTVDTIRKI